MARLYLYLLLLTGLCSFSYSQKVYAGLALSMGVGSNYEGDEKLYTYALLPFVNYEHSLSLKKKLLFGLNYYKVEDGLQLEVDGSRYCDECIEPRLTTSYIEVPVYYRWEPKPWSSWDFGLVFMIPVKSELAYQETILDESAEFLAFTPGAMRTRNSLNLLSNLFGFSIQKGFKINNLFLSVYSTAAYGSQIDEGDVYYYHAIFSGGFRAAYRLK